MRTFFFLSMVLLLAQACKDGGAKTLPNGYKYTIHKSNEGAKPVEGQVVTLDFQLITAEGKVLDDSRNSTQNKPAMTMPPADDERSSRNPMLAMIRLMSVGDSATVVVPVDSLPNPPDEYKETAFINYVVVVKSIEELEAYKAKMQEEQVKQQAAAKFKEEAASKEILPMFDKYMAGGYKDVKTLDNGLKITIIEPSDGPKAVAGDNVTVQYYGFLKDGTSFDNSFKVGRAFEFPIGQGMVIQGWDLGIPEVPRGAKAMLEIPWALAYGEAGSPPRIPAKSDLIFYVEVEKINNK